MKPLSEISTIRPSCKVSFNTCIDCGVLFTARKRHRKRCSVCNDQTVKSRTAKGLKRLMRKCLNPSCGIEFETYNIKQFACGDKCSDIVTNIRRQYNIKMRRFLGLCRSCGYEAYGNALCDKCQSKVTNTQKAKRVEWRRKNLCRECGSSDVMRGLTKCLNCYNLKSHRNYKSQYTRKESEFGTFVEYVDIKKLYYKYNGICNICGRKVNSKLVWPNPGCASKDHIIPVSKGGETSYKNMQLVHLRCNLSKGNRPVNGGEQLLLFG